MVSASDQPTIMLHRAQRAWPLRRVSGVGMNGRDGTGRFRLRTLHVLAAMAVFGVTHANRAGESGTGARAPYPAALVTLALRAAMVATRPLGSRVSPPAVGDPLPASMVVSEAQVKWLAARLDGDGASAANRLKYGYFRQDWPERWPSADVLAYLSDERATAEPDSPRALRLAMLIAYGRAVTPPYADWQAEYRTLWTHANALAAHPALLREAIGDYLDVAVPGIHRTTRASPGEVRAFLEVMFWRWLALPDESPAAFAAEASFPDWAGLAHAYNGVDLLWRVADAVAPDPAAIFPYRLRLARIALTPVRRGTRLACLDPVRASIQLEAAIKDEAFDARPGPLQATTFGLLAEAREALGQWDEALAARTSAARHDDTRGGARADLARTAHRAFQAAEARGDTEAAARYQARRETALAIGSATDAGDGERLAVARVLMDLSRFSEAHALLDGLLARETVPVDFRRRAALMKMEASTRTGDREAGKSALELWREWAKTSVPDPLDALMVDAYARKLAE